MNLSSQELESYVPVYDTVPSDWKDARPFLVEVLKKISNAVNIREIGWHLDEELLSGKAFIPSATPPGNETPQQFRQMLRMVVDTGTLPNNGTISIPHNITVDYNFTLINMFGGATDPINLISLPLPFVDSPVFNFPIEVYMDATNVNIITSSDRTTFTRSFIIIEYIQEV